MLYTHPLPQIYIMLISRNISGLPHVFQPPVPDITHPENMNPVAGTHRNSGAMNFLELVQWVWTQKHCHYFSQYTNCFSLLPPPLNLTSQGYMQAVSILVTQCPSL